jgi:hypothetical protein
MTSEELMAIVGHVPRIVKSDLQAKSVVLLVNDESGENHILGVGEDWKQMIECAALTIMLANERDYIKYSGEYQS